jgi:hypothetical protein
MIHEPPLEISKQKRYFLFGLACTHVLLASGEAYGWTALRPVLLDSGLFDAYDETTTPTRYPCPPASATVPGKDPASGRALESSRGRSF